MTGGKSSHYKVTKTRTITPGPIRVEKQETPPLDPMPKPRVWVVPASENVSPTSGNLLRDGFLQYDRGPEKAGHRRGNEIWNCKDKRVRIAVDANRVAKFQVVAELNGKPRRLMVKADDLVGPRPLPAARCVNIARVWYTRGKTGRDVSGRWDIPLTLVPVTDAVRVPPPDNPVPGQTNQAFMVEVRIPRMVLSGMYTTTLHVTDLDDPAYVEEFQIEVAARPDGKKHRSIVG